MVNQIISAYNTAFLFVFIPLNRPEKKFHYLGKLQMLVPLIIFVSISLSSNSDKMKKSTHLTNRYGTWK